MVDENGGVEVELIKPFAVLRETLERIGIANRKEKKLFPTCYAKKIYGKTYIYHFKELLKDPNLDDSDIKRKHTIIWLLEKWKLIKIKYAQVVDTNMSSKKIYVLSKKQKDEGWTISHKYHFESKFKTEGTK